MSLNNNAMLPPFAAASLKKSEPSAQPSFTQSIRRQRVSFSGAAESLVAAAGGAGGSGSYNDLASESSGMLPSPPTDGKRKGARVLGRCTQTVLQALRSPIAFPALMLLLLLGSIAASLRLSGQLEVEVAGRHVHMGRASSHQAELARTRAGVVALKRRVSELEVQVATLQKSSGQAGAQKVKAEEEKALAEAAMQAINAKNSELDGQRVKLVAQTQAARELLAKRQAQAQELAQKVGRLQDLVEAFVVDGTVPRKAAAVVAGAGVAVAAVPKAAAAGTTAAAA